MQFHTSRAEMLHKGCACTKTIIQEDATRVKSGGNAYIHVEFKWHGTQIEIKHFFGVHERKYIHKYSGLK